MLPRPKSGASQATLALLTATLAPEGVEHTQKFADFDAGEGEYVGPALQPATAVRLEFYTDNEFCRQLRIPLSMYTDLRPERISTQIEDHLRVWLRSAHTRGPCIPPLKRRGITAPRAPLFYKAPNSSRIRMYRFPLGKAALATRLVSAGTTLILFDLSITHDGFSISPTGSRSCVDRVGNDIC